MASEYMNFIETILSKPGLIVHEDEKLSKQEPTINFGDQESLANKSDF